jgi:hypothetical protein
VGVAGCRPVLFRAPPRVIFFGASPCGEHRKGHSNCSSRAAWTSRPRSGRRDGHRLPDARPTVLAAPASPQRDSPRRHSQHSRGMHLGSVASPPSDRTRPPACLARWCRTVACSLDGSGPLPGNCRRLPDCLPLAVRSDCTCAEALNHPQRCKKRPKHPISRNA